MGGVTVAMPPLKHSIRLQGASCDVRSVFRVQVCRKAQTSQHALVFTQFSEAFSCVTALLWIQGLRTLCTTLLLTFSPTRKVPLFSE